MATDEAQYRIKINGSPELVSNLEHVMKQDTQIKLESTGRSDEPSRLKLGLGEVSTIIAIVNGTITIAKLAYTIYQHLQNKPDQRVSVQTPLKTVEILGSDAKSEESVKALLLSAVHM